MMSDGRGLMVIKETAKTKAQQRNAAIKNWKVQCHVKIPILHKL